MMHKDNVVCAVKVAGKVLRESDGTVSLPFGCEYSILIKNLNSVRAMISVTVDGTVATEGTRLIIAANSSIELERYIRNGNLQSGNRFKFIERSADVEGHRGIGVEDGLIRVEAWKEHVQKFVDIPVPRYYDDPIPVPRPYYPPYPRPRRPWPMRPMAAGRPSLSASLRGGDPRMARSSPTPTQDSARSMRTETVMAAAGITVPGSESQQQFYSSSGFALEPQSVVLVLKLVGQVAGMPVEQPVTVDRKPECQTCGKVNKGDAQFCSRCGTALVLV